MTSYEPDGRTMRERMLAGDPYIADDPDLGEASFVAHDLMGAFNATGPREKPLRRALLEQLLGRSARTPRSGRRCTSTTAPRSASAPAASPTSA